MRLYPLMIVPTRSQGLRRSSKCLGLFLVDSDRLQDRIHFNYCLRSRHRLQPSLIVGCRRGNDPQSAH